MKRIAKVVGHGYTETVTIARREIRVKGTVQGVDFHRFVYCLANDMALARSVRNAAERVVPAWTRKARG